MSNKIRWSLFILYMAIFGSYCGLEIDTFVEDLPFFQWSTLLLFLNVLIILLVPLMLYAILSLIRPLWENRVLRIGFLFLNSIYIHFVILLAIYKSERNIDFDFFFFWHNISVAMSVLWKLYAPGLFALALSIIIVTFFQITAFSPVVTLLRKFPRKTWTVLTVIFISSFICQVLTMDKVRGSAAGFLYASFLSDRTLRIKYRDLYRDHIAALRSSKPEITGKETPSILGDVVIFVQQESLNDLLATPRITPNILQASRDGILFRKFYGNSIQSLRGYECILCGVPSSMERALVEDYPPEALNELNCLPKIFKSLGYYPILFYSGNPNPRVTNFFRYIGFEKILADEIMQPGDIQYDWGYREDIFFTRVQEYLEKHHPNEKLFIFITASASNHTPFEVLDDALLDKVPYPKPEKFQERLSNTTFVQDAYFGHLYDIFRRHYAHRGSLIAVSDHAWPIPIHKHNIYNERGAFEENFLITLLFVPPTTPGGLFATDTTVTHRFSQMDILPSILDLIGLQQNSWLGESFAPWLLAPGARMRMEPLKTKLSVQPYGGGFISVVDYPTKYLFDILGQDVKVYDLVKDPQERSPDIRDPEEYMFLIEDFFQNRKSPSTIPAPIGKALTSP